MKKYLTILIILLSIVLFSQTGSTNGLATEIIVKHNKTTLYKSKVPRCETTTNPVADSNNVMQ